jgi:clan AA aspartic protease (TIGR02281 family)
MGNQLDNRAPFNKRDFILGLVFLILLGFKLQANADILHLKNGRTIEGIIKKEDDSDISLELGFGVAKFPKDQIESIQRSSSEDLQLIRQEWVQEKEASEASDREIKHRQEYAPKQAVMDKQSGHIMVETTLNKKIKANLMLDTGSSLMLLSSRIAVSLGIDVSVNAGDIVELVLADGRKVKAKRIILENVSVQGSEVEKVEAAVLLEQDDKVFAHDGLLGMSFLKNFTFKIDQKNDKLILEKL